MAVNPMPEKNRFSVAVRNSRLFLRYDGKFNGIPYSFVEVPLTTIEAKQLANLLLVVSDEFERKIREKEPNGITT